MFKKSIAAVTFSFLMILSLVPGVSAEELLVVSEVPYYEIEEGMSAEVQEAIREINSVNARIEAEIVKNQEKASELHAEYISKLASEEDEAKQAELTANYEEEISHLIKALQKKAEEITLEGIKDATESGIEADIVLVEEDFADKTAKIDPIVVVSW
ncbi:hypothetical protein ON064_05015 [Planococcus sp. A6]|uniref:hypothetical protein n=1 Tax=Planococcus sp. A6 TaxID=2992760 RepID=UPI00237BDBB5|nr:hypothetical protein [Planococcus sp. A6]MDE0582406.1 hypothetical protein [Planococcus sp. A6]